MTSISTANKYRAILDRMGVETDPADGIFLHLTAPIDGGYRIVEIWDSQCLCTTFFAPRLRELPGIVPTPPGAPHLMPIAERT